MTLEKVRDTCLFPLIVTRAANTLASRRRNDSEEAVAMAARTVAMVIVMCERSVSRTRTLRVSSGLQCFCLWIIILHKCTVSISFRKRVQF